MAITNKSFYFMRHGETDWNRQRIYMGQTDIPLNEFGIQQARQAAKLLEGIDFASIASSTLMRAIHTAQIITEKVLKPITIINDLKECSYRFKNKFGVALYCSNNYSELILAILKSRGRIYAKNFA
jgi:broad specificity phosphatase PhoE